MSDHSGYKKPAPPGGALDFTEKWGPRNESTPIELVDKLLSTLPEGDPTRFDLFRLRQQIQEHELTLSEARAAIEKMDEVIKKVTSPANRIGTFLGFPKKEIAQDRHARARQRSLRRRRRSGLRQLRAGRQSCRRAQGWPSARRPGTRTAF